MSWWWNLEVWVIWNNRWEDVSILLLNHTLSTNHTCILLVMSKVIIWIEWVGHWSNWLGVWNLWFRFKMIRISFWRLIYIHLIAVWIGLQGLLTKLFILHLELILLLAKIALTTTINNLKISIDVHFLSWRLVVWEILSTLVNVQLKVSIRRKLCHLNLFLFTIFTVITHQSTWINVSIKYWSFSWFWSKDRLILLFIIWLA